MYDLHTFRWKESLIIFVLFVAFAFAHGRISAFVNGAVGIIWGLAMAALWLKASIAAASVPKEAIPGWMLWVAGIKSNPSWRWSRLYSVIGGGIVSLTLLLIMIGTNATWTYLILPVSVLSIWILGLVILEILLRHSLNKAHD